jgi:tetratricopeptide (TPR) repeat protein
MRFTTVFLFTASALVSMPASSAVTVIGNSSARVCFEAAESPLMPRAYHLEQCGNALTEEAGTPRNVAATYVNRGVLRVRIGKIDEAIADFDAAMALYPDEPEAYLDKGSALIRAGQPEAAVPLFGMALERNTRKPAFAYYGRAMAYEDMGNLQLAYSDYKRASAAAPKWDRPREELSRFEVKRR